MPNSEIGYFDPNTYGERGYSFIGPLLLFYDKLVVYGPVGSLIERAYDTEDLRKTSLTPGEFVSYIEQDVILPLGFESFFSREDRNQLHQPELRVITEFDEDLISSPSLSQKTYSIANTFKIESSPAIAKHIMDTHPSIKDRLSVEIAREQSLPQKYKDLKHNLDLIPKQLRRIQAQTEPDNLLPLAIIYDLLNNRHVMESQGSASIHAQYAEFRGIYRAIHGLDEDIREQSRQVEIIGDILRTCVSEITYGRLSSEQIDEFRVRCRTDFVSFIESAFGQYEEVEDFRKKKEYIIETVSRKLKNMKIHLAIGPDTLISMLPQLKVMSKPISLMIGGRPGTLRNQIYHSLYRPLNSTDRWVYHFVKLSE